MDLGRRHRTPSHPWWMISRILLYFHPSFICILVCEDYSIKWQFRSCLQRARRWTVIVLAFTKLAEALCVNLAFSYNERMALEACIFISIIILCQALGSVESWDFSYMELCKGSPRTRFLQSRALEKKGPSPTWPVHGLVKVSLPSRVLSWFMFQQKGLISFVLGCPIVVNNFSKIVVGGMY